MSKYVPPGPRSDLKWVGVDLDNTLASPIWTPDNPTSDIGDPLPNNLGKYRRLIASGKKGIIHTSRPWTDYEAIEYWLKFHDIPFREIQCGKPLFYAYIDDRAIRADENDNSEWL